MGRMKDLAIDTMNEAMDGIPGVYDYDDYEYWQYLKTYVPNKPAARYRHSL